MKFHKYSNLENVDTSLLDAGDVVMVRKGSSPYYWEQYKLTYDGELAFVRGVTDEQYNRLEQITQSLIDKLEDSYTKEQIDDIEDALRTLIVSTTAGLPEAFPNSGDTLTATDVGQWTILTEGTYHQPGYPSIEVAEGTVVFAQFDGTQFSVQREVELPVPENKLKDWTPGTYPAGSQVIYEGQIWEASETNGQTPGSSSYWLPKIDIIPTDRVQLNNFKAVQSDAVSREIRNRSLSTLNNDYLANFGYSLYSMVVSGDDVYMSLKAQNHDAITNTDSWKKLNFKPDGTIAVGDARSVSGGAVKEALDKVSENVVRLEGDYFTYDGYAHGETGLISGNDTFKNTGFLPIGKATEIKVRGSNTTSASVLNFYDENFNFIGRAVPSSDSSSNKEWTISSIPENAAFVISSAQTANTARYIRFNSVSNIDASLVKAFLKINDIKQNLQYRPQRIVRDFHIIPPDFSRVNGLNIFKTQQKIKNKKLRISYKFRFNRDVNVGDVLTRIPLLTVKGTHSSAGEIFFKAHVRSQKTDRLITNENRYTEAGKTILTTYPLPRHRTGFGWETNNPNTEAAKQKFEFPDRIYPEYSPLCGRDTFRLQFRGLLKFNPEKNIDDADVQQFFDNNDDWRITIDDTAVRVFSSTVNEVFDYSTYPTLSELYNAIEAKTALGESLELFEIESYDTGSSTNLNYGPAYPSNGLLRVENIPFVSTYPAMYYNQQDANTTRLDAFSFYAQFGLDDSEHVVEFVIDATQDGGLLNIDGQFIRYAAGEGAFNGAANLPRLQRMLDSDRVEIILGGDDNSTEALITPYDVVIETEDFTDFEFSMKNGRVASWYTPFIVGSGGHAIYKGRNIGTNPTGYDDGTPPPDSSLHVVPAKYKRHRSGYTGDDYISINALTSSTENYVRFIEELKKRGYLNITLNQLSDWFNGNAPLPHYKCFYIQLDDYRTYAFGDLDIRKYFTKTGTRISFCLELGKYVDEAYEGDTDGLEWISKYADTNANRLMLQKRIHQMQLLGWECVSHGEDGNTYTGMNSKELDRVSRESSKMSDYLGVYPNLMTWAASQYTVNSVKTFEHNGLSMILRSGGEYAAKCNNRFCVSRLYFDQLNWQNLLTKII